MSKQRRKVLVIQHPDGYLQVYADKDTDVMVLSIWDSENYDMGSEQEQIDALPWSYRDLHRADRCRATAMIRKPPKREPGLWDLLAAFKENCDQLRRRTRQEANDG